MKAWWAGLQTRERVLVGAGAAILCLVLLFTLVLQPLAAARTRMLASLATLEQTVANAEPQVAAILVARNGSTQPAVGPSLFALADGSARDAGLKDALKSLTPIDEKRVKVDMEMADFDTLVTWIEKLDRDHGVDVVEWSVNRELVPGVVSARMILNSNR